MNVSNLTKWLGLFGGLAMGVTQIAGGDMVNGVGIIAASLSSASVFKKPTL